jgi:hypothetical protein
MTWFKNLIKLNTDTISHDRKSPNGSIFVFSVFIQLERIYPLLGHRKNIWQNITTLAIESVKACSEPQIFGATKFVIQIKERKVRILFLDMIKAILDNTVQQIDDQLITKIFTICNSKGKKTLKISNS